MLSILFQIKEYKKVILIILSFAMKKIFVFISVTFFTSCILQAQPLYWNIWQPYPSGTPSNLNYLTLDAGGTKYLAVGDNGTFITSTNDGFSWSSLNTGFTNTLFSIYSQSVTNMVISGSNGFIAKSTNSGANFVPQNTGTSNTINSLGFYGANLGLAAGEGGTIIQTTNGGTNWSSVSSGTTANINYICSQTYSNYQALLVGDNGTVLMGRLIVPSLTFSFTPVNTGTTLSLKYAYMTDSANIWIAASGGKILHTINGGFSWKVINTGFTNDLYKIVLQSPNEVYACGSGGLILKSTDNGNTFTSMTSNSISDLKGFVIRNKVGVSVGNAGVAMRTILGGTGGTFAKQQAVLNSNNITSFVWNAGVFNQDLRTGNTPGMEWPKGTGKFTVFTTGLCLAGYVNSELRMANASYTGEYIGGYVENGIAKMNTTFQTFKIKQGDNCNNSVDYANWQAMIPFGAPYRDINSNGQYDPCIDIPGVKNAAQTIFVCLTDGFAQTHTTSEGFSGGTSPLNAEVHLTAWSYVDSNSLAFLNDVQFFKWEIINKNNQPWTGFYSSIVCDPDLGEAADDYIGCDSLRNLGYCFNATNVDGTGGGRTYGANPPAVGMRLLKTPIKRTGGVNDTIEFTAFNYQSCLGCGFVSACEISPNTPLEAYNYMRGYKKDGTPWLNAANTPPTQTKFCYSGDPETGTGWTEYTGKIKNCGGVLTGNVEASPPGDRRFIMSSGRDNFAFNAGDTQTVVMAQMVARGSSNKNSVTKLKQLSDNVYNLFKSGGISIGINNLSEVALDYFLYQNYPNPFNPSTTIKFSIPENLFVSLKIYDISGKLAADLVREKLSQGLYEYQWNASSFPSGVYFYKLETESFTQIKKMVLVK